MQNKTLTHYDVEALVDEELEGGDVQEMLTRIQKDDSLLGYYRQLKTQKQLLQEWWAHTKR